MLDVGLMLILVKMMMLLRYLVREYRFVERRCLHPRVDVYWDLMEPWCCLHWVRRMHHVRRLGGGVPLLLRHLHPVEL